MSSTRSINKHYSNPFTILQFLERSLEELRALLYSFDSGDDPIFHPTHQVADFKSTLLQWNLQDIMNQKIADGVTLTSLAQSYQSIHKYYREFIPLILQEAWDIIKESCLPAIPEFFPMKLYSVTQFSQDIQELKLIGHFPECVQHKSSYQVFLLHFGNCKILTLTKWMGATKDENDVVWDIMGIHLNRKQLPSTITLNQLMNKELKLSYLCSTITLSRAHQVCQVQPVNNVLRQIITGNLEAINDGADDNDADNKVGTDADALNASQCKVISRVLSRQDGVHLIQGPPGTGKSTTIVKLLEQLTEMKQHQILQCASSNKAVQVVAERFHKQYPDVPVLLAGTGEDLPESLEHILLHGIFPTLLSHMNSIYESLDLYTNDVTFDQAITQFNNIEARFTFIASQWTYFKIPQIFPEIPANMFIDQSEAFRTAITCQYMNNFIGDWCPPCIQDIVCSYLLEAPTANDCEDADIHSSYDEDFPPLPNSITTIEASPVIRWKSPYNQVVRKAGQLLQRNIRYVANQLYQNKDKFYKHLISTAQVVFATLSSSGQRLLQRHLHRVHTLIVDESTQSVEAETLIPFQYKPERVVLVGDTKQLPATVISQMAQEHGYKRSMMSRLKDDCKQDTLMLRKQYRMHPALSRWPSNRFYDSKLKNGVNAEDRASLIRDGCIIAAPRLFIQVDGKEDQVNGKSRRNVAEARKIVQLLLHLHRDSHSKIDILQAVGIITFYQEQVRCIQQHLALYPELSGINVNTVDGFQGQENDIIIISCVRSNEDNHIGFVQDFRRLNVAITRAKYHLYMFGNHKTLSNSRQYSRRSVRTDIALLMHDLKQHNEVATCDQMPWNLQEFKEEKHVTGTDLDGQSSSGICQNDSRSLSTAQKRRRRRKLRQQKNNK